MKIRVGRQTVDVRQTMADRVVGYFSPQAGMERLKARTMLALTGGGYEGGRRDRRSIRKWRPPEQSPNADILPDLPDLRGRSRDLRRNVPIVTGAFATTITNAIGDGLSLQSQVDRDVLKLSDAHADEKQTALEAEWEIFCRTCDFTRAQTHYAMQALTLGATLESGDVLVVRRYRKDPGDVYGTKIQLVEADRVCNPNRAADRQGMVAGVEFDADGVARGFQVANRHPLDIQPGQPALAWTRLPARDPETGLDLALLLFERLRPDQARGVPWVAPIVELVQELGNYTKAEAAAAVIGAMFTVFVKTPPADEQGPPVVGSDEASTGVERGKEIALEDSGAIVELDPGQDVSIAAPGRPNSAFDGFVSALCQHLGAALEIPYEVLIKRFTASYSASRAALETAWQFFRKRRSFIAWSFCQPSYEWMVWEAVASGRLDLPGFFEDPAIRAAWCGAEWIGPARINLDPKKEAEADEIDLRTRVKTRDEICMQRTGGTFERKHRQLVKEETAWAEDGPPVKPAGKGAPDPSRPPSAAPQDEGEGDDPDVPEREDEA